MGQASKKIVVGLSGGVDSSVTAMLLQKQGYHVEGLFMKNWEEDDTEDYCTAAEDVKDARSICDALGIPLHTVNLSAEYWESVFTQFIDEYKAGRTPNPDVFCNQEIKFRAFLEHALDLGADMIATGHYARIVEQKGKFILLKGLDDNKDQSYFLYRLNQEQLSRSLFPLGELKKPQIRQLAKQAGLITQDKKDSTGICFIGERPFKDFLSRFIPPETGEIRTTEGKVIGEHDGIFYYTLGQRQGLGIGGVKNAETAPWYVVAKDTQRNILTVAQGQDHPLLYSNSLHAIDLHWISDTAPDTTTTYHAKTRYRQPDQACRLTMLAKDRCRIEFNEPQRSVTPGQSVAVYQGEACLGGGIIDKTEVSARTS
jgi:tRNA-specific 2-thiouridylase